MTTDQSFENMGRVHSELSSKKPPKAFYSLTKENFKSIEKPFLTKKSKKHFLESLRSSIKFLDVEEKDLMEKELQISGHFRSILEILGLDLTDDDIVKTPQRVAKMYVREIFQGLYARNFPQITLVKNKIEYDQMILVKNINIVTFCKHHFVTIYGKAHIAYIPGEHIIGLSKINRIAQFLAKRPQVQERLTKQIADVLSDVLKTKDVGVSLHAKHHCVTARGVEDINSITSTYDLRGDFKNDSKTHTTFLQQTQNQCDDS